MHIVLLCEHEWDDPLRESCLFKVTISVPIKETRSIWWISRKQKNRVKQNHRFGVRKEDKRRGLSDLYDCDVQEDATEADRDGRGSHDSWTGQEPHGHREPCDAVPTCYDPWLQCHEQTCIQEQYIRHVGSFSLCLSMSPSLNCAGP